MTFDEVRQFISETGDSPEIKKYLDSLADQRVTQALKTAREKWEAEIPERLQAVIDERARKEKERQQRIDENRNIALRKIKDLQISEKIGFLALGNDFENMTTEFMDSRLDEAKETIKQMGNMPNPGRGNVSTIPDLRTATAEEILANLKHYNKSTI